MAMKDLQPCYYSHQPVRMRLVARFCYELLLPSEAVVYRCESSSLRQGKCSSTSLEVALLRRPIRKDDNARQIECRSNNSCRRPEPVTLRRDWSSAVSQIECFRMAL